MAARSVCDVAEMEARLHLGRNLEIGDREIGDLEIGAGVGGWLWCSGTCREISDFRFSIFSFHDSPVLRAAGFGGEDRLAEDAAELFGFADRGVEFGRRE